MSKKKITGIIFGAVIVLMAVSFIEIDTDKVNEIVEKNHEIAEQKKQAITQKYKADDAREWYIERQLDQSLNQLNQWYSPAQLEEMTPQLVEEITAQINVFSDEQVIQIWEEWK